jgi:hypothetical protein
VRIHGPRGLLALPPQLLLAWVLLPHAGVRARGQPPEGSASAELAEIAGDLDRIRPRRPRSSFGIRRSIKSSFGRRLLAGVAQTLQRRRMQAADLRRT